MTCDFKKIKKQIAAEADLYGHYSFDRIFTFLLKEIFRNDFKRTKEFMLSEAGGFEQKEIDRIVNQKLIHDVPVIKSLITE